jgi:hypothetical protein
MADPQEHYGIVVAGAMNPRIHHPGWYRFVELITDEELAAALKDAGTIATIPTASFSASQIQISCVLERWQISTTDSANVDRIVTITTRVFDELLKHTPIQAYGFNVQVHLSLGEAAVVAERLAALVPVAGLGIARSEFSAANYTLVANSGQKQRLTIHIEPSVFSPDAIYVAHNFHYEFEQTPTVQHFDLGAVLKVNVSHDVTDARRRTDAIVAALKDS